MSFKIASHVGALSMLLLSAPLARAAPPFVDRGIVLPRHDVAFDFGLGIAHANNTLGPGINLEGYGSIIRGLDLGFRTGFRFGAAGRDGDADGYGRPFDTETSARTVPSGPLGPGSEVLSNPEVRIRGAIVQGDVVEVALEGRFYTPFSDGVGLTFGVPLEFHVGRVVRIDTGIYVPILFHDPTKSFVSLPLALWIQATDRLWVGPLLGVRFFSNARGWVEAPLGFGLGYQIARAFDFKTWFQFRDVANGAATAWGFGGGIEARIE